MKQAVVESLFKEVKLKKEEIEGLIKTPPEDEMGDFAFPCFSLAKEMGKNPLLIAEELAEKLRKKGLGKDISNVEARRGYVNFFVDKKILARKVLKGFKFEKKNESIVMDYSHPNVAKHFGIHNLRSTLIGHSLYNILKAVGRNVWSVNHLGDWGTQFGKLIVAYKKWGKKIQNVEDLNKLYVKFHNEAEKNDRLNDLAREEFKKLEGGDGENLKLWKKFYDISWKEFARVYDILGIKFDEVKGESGFRDISDVMKMLEKKGLLEKSEGAKIVKVLGDNPPLIFEKSDEASTYASRDLMAIFDRMKKKPDKILYVVDVAQSLHFAQVFEVAKKLGVKVDLVHVKFGRLRFKQEGMSTRKGNVILFEDLLKKLEEKAVKQVEDKNPGLKNKKNAVRKVALAAIIFNDLKQDRKLDVVFDWEEALRAEGRTGVYLLYTYVRASGILKKIKNKKEVRIFDLNKYEVRLIKKLDIFPEVVERAGRNYAPHILAEYCYGLAQIFNEFYHNCPVLGSAEEGFRLGLVKSFRNVMKECLNLLGIEEIEEM